MRFEIIQGLLLPFTGTSLGAACVLLMKREMNFMMQRCMTGFAAGVMVAASIWSLLIPAIDQVDSMGKWSFVPAVVGFWIGILFLLLLDRVVPHMHIAINEADGPRSHFSRTMMMVFAVVLHNIPEGMAVGIVYTSWQSGNTAISLAGAFSLSLGIAIQNFPEGAIISMPLKSEGVSKAKSFFYGILSGAVEPIAASVTILAASAVLPILPYLLSLAAGAMMYVVVEELIPEMSAGHHSNLGTICFALGFTLMMAMDVALG